MLKLLLLLLLYGVGKSLNFGPVVVSGKMISPIKDDGGLWNVKTDIFVFMKALSSLVFHNVCQLLLVLLICY